MAGGKCLGDVACDPCNVACNGGNKHDAQKLRTSRWDYVGSSAASQGAAYQAGASSASPLGASAALSKVTIS